MQGREQPRLDPRVIAQLMSFRRPDVERLLSQIPRFRFRPGKADRKPEQRLVVFAYNRFKLIH